MIRSNPCKLCGSPWHTKTFCLLNKSKRIKTKGDTRWYNARRKWFALNPPNDENFYVCYLCEKWLAPEDTTLDHVIPRSHDSTLRYDLTNLKPCCWTCNGLKGSQSLDSYLAKA